MWNRRDFLKGSTLAASSLAINHSQAKPPTLPYPKHENAQQLPDLAPARWLWYPSGRTLPNTFVLFRRQLKLKANIVSARGWMYGDSRYLLHVNGQRIQFGPGPCDPRYPEADPLELGEALQVGENTIGATVLYYGQGDGTWPGGKPGFLFFLEIEYASGERQKLVSDGEWDCKVADSWRPGQYKRWYLRALQEDFDAQKYPYGWDENDFAMDDSWVPAMELIGDPNQPPLAHNYPDYLGNIGLTGEVQPMRPRSTPMLDEFTVPVKHLAYSFYAGWRIDPMLYFDMQTLMAYETGLGVAVEKAGERSWRVKRSPKDGSVLTFEMSEQVVGWPYFTIEAPEGTIVELLVHEAHDPNRPQIINTHFNAWTRFRCREGKQTFMCFDYESLRWLQLHIHPGEGEVIISEPGVLRRRYPWPHTPHLQLKDQSLQRLAKATFNTLDNNAQETIVDGMGRERQQYCGDVGHTLHVLCGIMGEYQLAGRFIRTFSQGMTLDGYFLDCWPAYDRLARISQRQLGLTPWGPLLDHGVAFCFDNWHYYQYTGDKETLMETFPRLLRFATYLQSIQQEDGLLPVENIGVPTVWLDNYYDSQRDKQCAFNLYIAAAMRYALAPLCEVMGEDSWKQQLERFAKQVLSATQRSFWDQNEEVYVSNLPWRNQRSHFDERSLSLSILYDLCPNSRLEKAVELLAKPPADNYAKAFPANAGWRYWALAKAGEVDVILEDLRQRWANLPSVLLNNSLQEEWSVKADANAQWSHAAMAPLYVYSMCLLGIRPIVAGGKIIEICPQFGALEDLSFRYYCPSGSVLFSMQRSSGERFFGWEVSG
ncbi:MAG: alpha-L-rhamnosidase N-terminal domain-containing protein, partial [Bacteroidota bacterium]